MIRLSSPLYPDISDILVRKSEGRKTLSKLTFGEKIARMEQLREHLSPFRRRRADGAKQAVRETTSHT